MITMHTIIPTAARKGEGTGCNSNIGFQINKNGSIKPAMDALTASIAVGRYLAPANFEAIIDAMPMGGVTMEKQAK